MKRQVEQGLERVTPTLMKQVADQLVEKLVEPETAGCMVTLTRLLLAARKDLSVPM